MKSAVFRISLSRIVFISMSLIFSYNYGEQDENQKNQENVIKAEQSEPKNKSKIQSQENTLKEVISNTEVTEQSEKTLNSKIKETVLEENVEKYKDNKEKDKKNSNIDFDNLTDSELIDVKVDIDAPSYEQIIPILGWNRYSGDSAGSVREWRRWWQYLNLSTPVIMQWIDGLILRIYPDNEIYRAIFVKGIYEPNLIVVINSILPKEGVFIDVGANNGYFSILATKAVGPNGSVFAIEPSSRDYNRLVDNIIINDLQNVISAYRLAFSDKKEKGILKIAAEERSALNTLGNEFSFKGIDKISEESVDLMTLDDFVFDNQIKRVDVIKLDIEGSELKALNGAKQTIKKFHPVIMLGVNKNALKASGTSREEIKQLLSDLKYDIYKIVDEEHFSLKLISKLELENINVVFCFPKGSKIPVLPQPQSKTYIEKIRNFFEIK